MVGLQGFLKNILFPNLGVSFQRGFCIPKWSLDSGTLAQKSRAGEQAEKRFTAKLFHCFSDASLEMFNFEGNNTAHFYIHNSKSKTWLSEDKVFKGRQSICLTSGYFELE